MFYWLYVSFKELSYFLKKFVVKLIRLYKRKKEIVVIEMYFGEQKCSFIALLRKISLAPLYLGVLLYLTVVFMIFSKSFIQFVCVCTITIFFLC